MCKRKVGLNGSAWEGLGEEGEREPRGGLVGVVGARDELEEGREGIRIGVGNLPHGAACGGRKMCQWLVAGW